MATFRFKLQPLLDQRERIEQDRQIALAKLESQRSEIESTIRSKQSDIDRSRHAARDALAPGKSIDLKGARSSAVAALKHQAEAQASTLKLAGLYKQIDAARNDLARATAARRAIELLKEQRKAQHERELARRDAALIDEIATTSAARSAGDTL